MDEERQAKQELERGALEFFEAIVTAGRYRIGSDNFSFKIETNLSCLPADREKGSLFGQDIQSALDAAERIIKAQQH